MLFLGACAVKELRNSRVDLNHLLDYFMKTIYRSRTSRNGWKLWRIRSALRWNHESKTGTAADRSPGLLNRLVLDVLPHESVHGCHLPKTGRPKQPQVGGRMESFEFREKYARAYFSENSGKFRALRGRWHCLGTGSRHGCTDAACPCSCAESAAE